MSRKSAMRRIWPGMSRLRLAKCTNSTLGSSRISHQLRTFSQNGQNGWPSRSIQSRQYWRTSAGGGSIGGPTRPGRVVQRLVPRGVGVGVVVVHAPHHVAAVAADVEVLGLRREAQRIDRQVGLQEAAVGLRLDQRQLHRLRAARAGRATATSRPPRGRGSPSNSSWPTICCIQVVPDLA